MPAILWNADSLDWQCFDSKIIIEKLKHEIKEMVFYSSMILNIIIKKRLQQL